MSSMCTNLGLLGVFKYAMFAQANLNWLLADLRARGLPHLQITLPIGISFYTFQTMSYTIDVYQGDAPAGAVASATSPASWRCFPS